MMSGITHGKAVATLEKLDGSVYANVYLKSVNGKGEAAAECAREDISTDLYMDEDALVNMKRVPDGCSVTVTFRYSIDYSTDYWGECDYEIAYSKVKVLRRSSTRNTRRKRKAFYIPKNAR